MIKQESATEGDILKILRLRLENTDIPERPVEEDLLPGEPPLNFHEEEEGQLTFDNRHPAESSPDRANQALIEENEFLKQQLDRIKERINDYQEMLKSFKELQDEVAARESQIYEKESAIGLLTANVRGLQKKKANLEFQLQKMVRMLEQQRQETERYEQQALEAIEKIRQKERDTVDMLAKHEKEIRALQNQKQDFAEQFQNVKDETKKLIAKLNSISLQKENKLLQQIENIKTKYDQNQSKLIAANSLNESLEEVVRNLKETISANRSEYERGVMNIKLQSQKHIGELRLIKESDTNRIVSDIKVELERKEKENTKVLSALTLKENQIRQHQQEIQRMRSREQLKLQKTIEDFERKIEKKQTEIQNLKGQLQLKDQEINSAETENQQNITKVQALQRNIRDMYEQCTQLQGKLMDSTKDKSVISSQNNQLKLELKSFKQIASHYEGKSKTFNQEQTQYTIEIRDLKAKVSQLQDANQSSEKRIKQLVVAFTKSRESEDKLLHQNRQMSQSLIEKDITIEKLNLNVQKQKSFIQTYKTQSQKVKQNTERRWKDLKRLYEGQLQALEGRLKASEARQKAIHIQLQNTERMCKQYEYELTMSTDIKEIEHSYRN